MSTELLTRHEANPILTPACWPYPVNTVFNAAATRLASGHTVLLARVEDRSGISHLCAARSKNGVSDWIIDDKPTLLPSPEHPEEEWGIEDPRITYLAEMERYAVTYTCYSKLGPGVSLALTSDFVTFERLGNILLPENKDAALFPSKIQGRWAIIHRPVPYSVSGANMWVSFSDDLRHWGDHRVLLETRSGPYWDGSKIGLSPPPIETPRGWLLLYHGARGTVSSTNYYVGLALMDREDPTRCLARGTDWIFGPDASYERNGDVDNVVFPCGWTLDEDGDTLQIYYGAADTSIGLATTRVSEMITWLGR
jgi:predicted GH43/DUF377 family glycosyl hydrolase